MPIQEHTSAMTSIKQVPAGFKIVDKYFGWQSYTVNLDIGGGKYDLMTEKLLEKSVTNMIYDPYNRSQVHNSDIIHTVLRIKGVDTVTIFNVLNVIKERIIQSEVLCLAKSALKVGGVCVCQINIYEPCKGLRSDKKGHISTL
jgi:hypothetical protein